MQTFYRSFLAPLLPQQSWARRMQNMYSSSPLCLLPFIHRMQASVCGMQSMFVPCSGPCNPQTTHCQQLSFFDLPACCMLALWHVASICCAWAQPAPSLLYLHQHVSDSLPRAKPQPASILAQRAALTRRCATVQAFAALTDVIKADRYLQPHYRYYVREVRKAAYVQVRTSIVR